LEFSKLISRKKKKKSRVGFDSFLVSAMEKERLINSSNDDYAAHSGTFSDSRTGSEWESDSFASANDKMHLSKNNERDIDDDADDLDDLDDDAIVLSPQWCTCFPFDVYPFLVLGLICFMTFGSYWVFDTPGAIQTQLRTWFGGPLFYTNSMNLTLYSIYSYPNIFLAFFGGLIMDRWTGVRWGAIIFTSLIFVGQTVFSLGIDGKAYYVCLAGRFIFGLGGESLTVAQNTFTTRWFDGKVLALAFGLVVSFSRIGSSINFVVTPLLAVTGVPVAVWFGTVTCLFSLLATCGCAALDYIGRSRIKRQKGADEPDMKITDVKMIPLPGWILFLVCIFFYVAVLTFYTVASSIMQSTGKGYKPVVASAFISIPNLVSIVGSPAFGKLVDYFGRALWFIVAASLMLVVGHVLFLGNANEWFEISPIPIMIWVGIAYSMGAAAMWPILSYIVPTSILSTAYGTMTALQNAGLAIFPQIIGALQDAQGISGTKLVFTLPLVIFISSALISAGLTTLLVALDRRYTEGRLNASGAERALMAEHGTELDDAVAPGHLLVPIPASTYLAESNIVRPNLRVPKTATQVRRNYLGRLGIYQAPSLHASQYP
jgi:MFS family permease